MKIKYQRPRGTQDLLPDYMEKWNYIEGIWRSIATIFGYREIVTPMFEHTELFARGAGDTSDIVSKEMYTFLDRADRSISLRPEGTSAVVRAYLENNLTEWVQPVKLFYLVPMFRYEKPQAGRFRQHTQYGVEVIGSAAPFTDAEVIKLVLMFYEKLKIQGIKLHLNSVGDEMCRPVYHAKLKEYLESVSASLCKDCQGRLERNPLRVMDCKQQGCQAYLQDAPKMIDHLSPESRDHFDKVCAYLTEWGVPYSINPRLVRGLDYYTRTAFEVISEHLGAQNAIAGGGRYDGLVELIGGKPTPAVGFGAGMERLISVLEQQDISFPESNSLDVFVISLGDVARKIGEKIVWQLRSKGISSDLDHLGSGKMKTQLNKAIKLNARYALILGEDEIAQNMVGLRDLKTTEQSLVPLEDMADKIKTLLE